MRAALTIGGVLLVLLVGASLDSHAPARASEDEPTRCVPEVEGLLPHGATGGGDAVLMLHGWTGSASTWSDPISFTANAYNEPLDRSLVDQVKRLGDTDVWLLNYQRYSARWVTDDRVGGAVADAVDCLADAYDRPIGVVASSMGGLAVRQVASDDDRADRIAALVTFGTPHDGSDIAHVVAGSLGATSEPLLLSAVGVPGISLSITGELLRFCGTRTTESLDACTTLVEPLTALDSEAGKALRSGSDELNVLPPYPEVPDDFPTLSLAGDVEVVSRASSGLFYHDLGSVSLGDMIVPSSSATAMGQSEHTSTCRHVMETPLPVPGTNELHTRVGELIGTRSYDAAEHDGLMRLLSTPCFHTRLNQTLELTNQAIGFLADHLTGDAAGEEPLDADAGARDVSAGQARGAPVMLVIDTSESMREDDGAGTVRLDGAKTAIADMLQELRPGTRVGIRAYSDPGGPDCNGGRDVLALSALDATRATALVDTLSADANTPTGPALTEAVEALRTAGYQDGQLVLVSDGESNCGDPPCEVAQAIHDDGFDVTVNTLGFQISQEGREELTCIAAATDGRHVDADDSQQLAEELRALSGAELEITIDHPAAVPAGLRLAVDVTVHNPSQVLAEAAQLSLSFDDEGADPIFPPVLPPRFALGNVPAGESVTRTWNLVAGASEQVGSATGRVTASAAALQPVSETVAFDVVADLPDLDDAGALLRPASDDRSRVAILGDGYSAGEGAGSYLPAADGSDDGCHRSLGTYAVSLFDTDQVDLLACSAAVVADVYQPQADRGDTPAQLEALDRLAQAPELALLTLGWSDVGVGQLLADCLETTDCHEDLERMHEVLADVELLVPRLTRAYQDVAARLDQRGTVAVLSYPLVLPGRGSPGCTGLDPDEVAYLNHVVRQLNAAAQRAVRAAAANGHDVVSVPHTAQAVLPSHTACHPEPYIHSIDAADSPWQRELHHPTAEGYRAMTHALVRASQTTRDEPPAQPVAADGEVTGDQAVLPIDSGRTVDVDLRGNASPATTDLRRGDRIDLAADGFAAGAEVGVRLRSTPIALAAVIADDDGAVDTTVHVPASMPAGEHRLTLRGLDTELAEHRPEQAIRVRPERPRWLTAATVGATLAALFTLGGLVAIVRTRPRQGTPHD